MKIKDLPENAVYKGVHNTYPGVHNVYSGVQDIYPRVTSKDTAEKKSDVGGLTGGNRKGFFNQH